MEWIRLRRFSLLLAAVSFSLLTGVMLLGAGMGSGEQPEVFPHRISCTAMTVNRLAVYDGPFYEDGSGDEVWNVAAAEVYNGGDCVIPYAYITVTVDDTRLVFEATMLPPGGTVLIPEASGQKYISGKIQSIFGWNTVDPQPAQPEIQVVEKDMDKIQVYNGSNKTVTGLMIYYRTYYREGNIYPGGRALCIQIPPIGQGETVTVCPERYVAGCTEIVYIQA